MGGKKKNIMIKIQKNSNKNGLKVNLIFAQKLQGKVLSLSMHKTASVEVNRLFEQQIYKKKSNISKTYLAHNVECICKVDDKVELKPCRPLSKRKGFIVSRVISSATTE